MNIFSGKAGGDMANLCPLISEVMEAIQADMSFDINGEKMTFSEDGLGKAQIEPILGQNEGPFKISGNPLAKTPGYPARFGRSNNLEINDYGVQLSIKGKAGMSESFSYQSE